MYADQLSFIDNLCKSNQNQLTWNDSVYKTVLLGNFWRFHAKFWLNSRKTKKWKYQLALKSVAFFNETRSKTIRICHNNLFNPSSSEYRIDGVCINWYEDKQNHMKKKQQRREDKACLALFFDWFYCLFGCVRWRRNSSLIDNP